MSIILNSIILINISIATSLFYKTSSTFQLNSVSFGALCLILYYNFLTNLNFLLSLLIILVITVIYAYLISVSTHYILEKVSSNKKKIDPSIIELAYFGLLTPTIFMFYDRYNIDVNFLRDTIDNNMLVIIVITCMLLVSIITLNYKYRYISRINLIYENKKFYNTLFSDYKLILIGSHIISYVLVILSFLLFAIPANTQASFSNLLELFLYGLGIWLLSSDKLLLLFIVSILVSWVYVDLRVEFPWIHENYLPLIIVTLGIITQLHVKRFFR